MSEQEFAAGHVFFRPGDPADRAYLLQEGQVEQLTGSGDSLTRVGLFEPGGVFGEMALIEERPRLLTARAVTAVRAVPMTREEFEHHLANDPGRARQYLRSLFERLRSLTARLGDPGAPGRSALLPVAKPSAVKPPAVQGPVEFPHAAGEAAGWAVVLHPLTRKAAETLPDTGLRVTRFPLRIGRVAGTGEPEALDLNDLWLLDSMPYNISRNHCQIDVDEEGPVIVDRGSHLGCGVNEEWIGGRAVASTAPLEPGENVLVVGSRMSPYQFRVVVGPA